MARCLFIILLWFMSSCKSSQNNAVYTESFLLRYCDPNNPGCYLAIPIDKRSFTVLDNDIVRSLVYYDHFFDSYPDYNSFLEDLMNKPGCITLKNYLPNITIEKTDNDFQKAILENQNEYLNEWGPSSYTIKEERKDKLFLIIKAFFDNGDYIYYNDYYGAYIIHKDPIVLPSPPIHD